MDNLEEVAVTLTDFRNWQNGSRYSVRGERSDVSRVKFEDPGPHFVIIMSVLLRISGEYKLKRLGSVELKPSKKPKNGVMVLVGNPFIKFKVHNTILVNVFTQHKILKAGDLNTMNTFFFIKVIIRTTKWELKGKLCFCFIIDHPTQSRLLWTIGLFLIIYNKDSYSHISITE